MLCTGARRPGVSSAAKETEDRQNVEDECGGNDIVEKVAVKISVTDHVAGRVGFHCPRKDQDSGPDPLNDQAPGRDMILVQLADSPEKETVAGHCVVGARPGQN